jgi:DnaK suppressor protein
MSLRCKDLRFGAEQEMELADLAKKPLQKAGQTDKPKKRPSAAARAAQGRNKKTGRGLAAPAKTARAARTKPPPRRSTKPVAADKAARLKDGQARSARPAPLPPAESNQRTETFLTPTETEQFRQLLVAKRAEILGDVSTLHNEAVTKDREDATSDVSSMPIHMADLGTDNYELEFTLGLIEGERAILREIEEALERIRQGTYGVCLATGRPIGKARLKAKPWAKYCYEYTLAQEQGQARRF